VDFNKIYKAPSLPKLSKRNISSSVLRGASVVSAAPKLGTSRFSFLKSTASVEGLKQNSVSDALTETNRILVEIQNQLATDFAFRIAEEKEQTKKIRAAESKKRFLTKEGAIEKIKSIGSGLKNQVDKILAPTKSIFQKIIDFFKIILTGIVLNTAFKWLENPENQKKLGQFFGFLAEHWKWVLATLGTVILVDVIGKLVIAAQGIMAAFALLTSPAGLTILAAIAAFGAGSYVEKEQAKVDEKLLKRRIEESRAKGKPLTSKQIEKERLLNLQNRTSISQDNTDAATQGLSIFIQKLFNRGLSKGGLVQGFSTGGTVGGKGSGNVDTVPAMLAPGEYVVRTAATRIFKPFLSDINENAGRLFDQFKQAIIGLTSVVATQKETSAAFNKVLEDFNKFLDSEIRKRNMGATGGGIGGGNINIRTSTPSKSGTDVMSPSSGSNVNVSNISINNNISPGSSMMGNAGVIRPRTTPRQEKVYNTISTKPSPRTNIIPINLPPIKSKPPEISTPTRTATDVPNISSVNIANPYMQLTPELYGIFV
jgi:hypothetical protein